MNEVELYKQGGEENIYEWVKRRNIEHVVCRRYIKEEGGTNDLHNLYIANSKENEKRSDMPFHWKNPRTCQKVYNVNKKEDQIAILASIAYVAFLYPNLFSKYFSKMITLETFYEWMYKNRHITEELVKRNEKIYKIQGNRNLFLQYPFLYQIMFEEDWKEIRWIENIKAIYWSYKWR
jgi:endonuclease I